jgi:tRNA 5-methylaminomethyl-2-thiouridine biosynthesis bifunctional protein
MKPLPTTSKIIESARIDWQQSTPVSKQFNDVYFSRDNGYEETQYVFVQQNHLSERWATLQKKSFTIGETGFGTGLNFLCAAQLWREHCQQHLLPEDAHLHFVSVEKFPLNRSDLTQACAHLPHLDWITQPLLAQYPALVRGTHRLYFHQFNITLTLLFGDALDHFKQLDGVIDAWFLDGFAPSKNEGMWQPELFKHLARLSHTGTTLSTFTAAGFVKRGLHAVGFDIEKVPGYGRKRDMLRGQFSTHIEPIEWQPHTAKPWFHYAYHNRINIPGNVAVIGAGLAGCTIARSLAKRGWKVTLFEKELSIASQGSGNPTGITFTKLSLHDTPQNRYYQSAYLYACRYLRSVLEQHEITEGQDWHLNGLLRLAYNDKESAEQTALARGPYWPIEWLEPLTPEQILQKTGLQTHLHGMLLKDGGWLNPEVLCQQLLHHPNITVSTGYTVDRLQQKSNLWQLNNDSTLFDSVVLANAFGCNQFPFSTHLPLRSVRGQISYVAQTEQSANLRHAINYEGYINPARNGFHCVGATFNPKLADPDQRAQDHQWNCNQLATTLPELSAQLKVPVADKLRGRVGFRCQTPDFLPIIGPLPNPERFTSIYADLGKGFLKRAFPQGENLAGLYVSCGHGSRGITSSCFAAEIVASYITGEPQPVDREVLFAVHPARFLIRDIIKNSH